MSKSVYTQAMVKKWQPNQPLMQKFVRLAQHLVMTLGQ